VETIAENVIIELKQDVQGFNDTADPSVDLVD